MMIIQIKDFFGGWEGGGWGSEEGAGQEYSAKRRGGWRIQSNNSYQ